MRSTVRTSFALVCSRLLYLTLVLACSRLFTLAEMKNRQSHAWSKERAAVLRLVFGVDWEMKCFPQEHEGCYYRTYRDPNGWFHRLVKEFKKKEDGTFDWQRWREVSKEGSRKTDEGDLSYYLMRKCFFCEYCQANSRSYDKEVFDYVCSFIDPDDQNPWVKGKFFEREKRERKNAVTIHIDTGGRVVATTYKSEQEARRKTGIGLSTIQKSRKKHRGDQVGQLDFTKTRETKIKFAATDPVESE